MTGTDPDYISAMEHFEAMRHEDIHRATQQINAGEILRIAGVWVNAATMLQTSFPLTRSSADRVMDTAEWEGEAAEAAEACVRGFADSVDELARVIGEVGARLGAVAAAAEAVKIAVVPPGNSGPVGALARLLDAANVIDASMVAEMLRQEAVLAMNMVYKPAYTTAGTGVPALPEPPPAPQALPPLDPPRPQVTPLAGADSGPAPTDSTSPTPGDAPASPGTPAPSSPTPESAPASPAPEPEPTAPPPPTSERPAPTGTPEPTETPQPTEESPPPAQEPPPADPSTREVPPAVPEPPPAPTPDSTGAPLSDPAGQPGITGPVPDGRAPDQPGVIPPSP